MKIVERFPKQVRELEHVWIPMPDGCRLSARIWLPDDADRSPVPAIIESIPYRKRDWTRSRDEPMHRYFAGHGYAAVRIDLRGSGESEGLLGDEYLDREQEDCVEAIRWIASQPWCTGAVGMMGKSWGGFNALQVAARRPPQLKGIITVCAADDRYADDAHYMGGCLLNENLLWGSVLFTLNAQPPDPDLVGPRWRSMWLERLEHNPLFVETWLRHQRRDDYWKRGSICEEYSRIVCPVYAVGGWADAYSNAVPRLLAGLSAPRKGLIGPWAHLYPHQGVPGPAIGFLQEALLFWDQTLGGKDTGILNEPFYRVWMQESVPPRPFYADRPGRWVAEERWPSDRIRAERYHLNRGSLDPIAGPETELACRSPQTVGMAAGRWCGFGAPGEMPTDQREDAAHSLLFETGPFRDRVEIFGAPEVTLTLSSDRPNAMVAVRLNDVAPDGASTRVTYGLLNLTHRDGHEHPAALRPGERYEVRVRLNEVAHAFPAGHRMRLAISTSYWPLAWPSPEPVTLTLFAGASRLDLPVRPPDPRDDRLRPFGRPEGAPPPESIDLDPSRTERIVREDPGTGEIVVTVRRDADGSGDPALQRLEPIDLDLGHAIIERYRIRPDDPLSARAEIDHAIVLRREGWAVRIDTTTRLEATKKDFRLRAELEASEDGKAIFSRRWDRSIRRDLV